MTKEEAKKKLYYEWQSFLEHNIDYGGISEAYKIAFEALDQEPCEDAISRRAVLEIVEREQNKGDALSEIEKLPHINPEPKTGYWNAYYTEQKGNDVFNCQECGQTFVVMQGKDYMNYCPNCGAKMEE